MTASIDFDCKHAWQVGALRLAVILGCALLLLLGSAGAAHAAEITVDDPGAGSTGCTLAAAVIAANNDNPSGSSPCAVATGAGLPARQALAAATAQDPAPNDATASTEEPALPPGASQAWWAGVQAMIKRELYFIAPAASPGDAPGDAPGGGYAASNPAANLAIHFPPDGGFWVTAAPAQPGATQADVDVDVDADAAAVADAAADWRWGVRPLRLQVGDVVHDLGQPQAAVVTENRLEQRYTTSGFALTEWFVNDEAGLRQNFTLSSRPPGPTDQPLRLELAGLGDLSLVVDDEARPSPCAMQRVTPAWSTETCTSMTPMARPYPAILWWTQTRRAPARWQLWWTTLAPATPSPLIP